MSPRWSLTQGRFVTVLLVAASLESSAFAGGAELRQAFVTSATGTGDLGSWAESNGTDGIAGGNAICQNLAESAGLADPATHLPEFRAWLSDAATDAWCNVQGLAGKRTGEPTVCGGATLPPSGPWVRTDGLLFAGSLAALASVPVYVFVPLDREENGEPIAGTFSFFTGTTVLGTHSSADCAGWSATTGQGQPGSSHANFAWATQSVLSLCSTPQRLACFELGEGVPVRKPSDPGHLAFLSSISVTGNFGDTPQAGGAVGLAAGDAICSSLAAAARLPEPASFRVWASDTSHDAICHIHGLTGFASNGCDGAPAPPATPYRRIDGFQLATDIDDLIDGQLDTSLSIDEKGFPTPAVTFTGTAIDGTLVSGQTCTDWTSTATTARPGFSGSREARWTANGGLVCNATNRLYCMSSAITIFWDGFETFSTNAWSATIR